MQRHFLLIEDDSNIVDFMEVVLQREHYNFTSVGTGMEALMLLQEETIDFILLDLGLPDIQAIPDADFSDQIFWLQRIGFDFFANV